MWRSTEAQRQSVKAYKAIYATLGKKISLQSDALSARVGLCSNGFDARCRQIRSEVSYLYQFRQIDTKYLTFTNGEWWTRDTFFYNLITIILFQIYGKVCMLVTMMDTGSSWSTLNWFYLWWLVSESRNEGIWFCFESLYAFIHFVSPFRNTNCHSSCHILIWIHSRIFPGESYLVTNMVKHTHAYKVFTHSEIPTSVT